MTKDQRTVLVLVGLALIVVALASPWSPIKTTNAPVSGLDDVIWRQGYPAGHAHLCPPGDIEGGPMAGPHSLYSRPSRPGHNRTGLIDHGWDWVLDPPSERGI